MDNQDKNESKKKGRGKDKVKRQPYTKPVAKQDKKPTAIKLTYLEEKACQAYVTIGTGNKTSAYKRAGYKCDNSKPETINKNASQLFLKPHIISRIAELEASVQEKTVLNIVQLSQRLTEMVESDPAGFFDEDGNILSVDQMSKQNRMIIKDIETVEANGKGRVRKVTSIDKTRLIDMLLKINGGYVDHNMQKSPIINNNVFDASGFTVDELKQIREKGFKKNDVDG